MKTVLVISVSNCPELFNPDQRDLNQNGIGDACDPACRLVADLDDDCDVDLGDLAIMSGEWLDRRPFWPLISDHG